MIPRTDRPTRDMRAAGGRGSFFKRRIVTWYPFDKGGRWMVPAPSLHLRRTVRALIAATLLMLMLLVVGVIAVT
jgi:hypothetical protein